MKTHMPIILVLLSAMFSAVADDEAGNVPVVRASTYGRLYAKSVPTESYGQKGTTQVFRVQGGKDVMESQYDWYANEIYLGGAGDETLVRFGPWQRGRTIRTNDFAIGIYRGGKTIKEYSTGDKERMGSGVSHSVSHYQVFGERMGFRWLAGAKDGNSHVYEVKGVSGKVFAFDLDTGAVVGETPAMVSDNAVAPMLNAVITARKALADKMPARAGEYTMIGAQRMAIKGGGWRVTFKPADSLEKEERTAGGEVFVNIDAAGGRTEITYGE